VNPEDVFTPGRYPRANFITREEFQPGESIQWTLKSGAAIQLTGPPDSGRTCFTEHLAAGQPLLTVRGSDIDEHDDVARHLFDGLVGEDSTLPPALRPSADRIREVRDQPRDQLRVVDRALDTGEIAVLYDDFDAISKEIQSYVAQLLKGQYERGVNLFVTSTPAGSDELFIANGDLRGRVRTVDVPAWDAAALSAIARNGFDLLDVDIDEETIERFVTQADGSPTEMHRLCLTAV